MLQLLKENTNLVKLVDALENNMFGIAGLIFHWTPLPNYPTQTFEVIEPRSCFSVYFVYILYILVNENKEIKTLNNTVHLFIWLFIASLCSISTSLSRAWYTAQLDVILFSKRVNNPH